MLACLLHFIGSDADVDVYCILCYDLLCACKSVCVHDVCVSVSLYVYDYVCLHVTLIKCFRVCVCLCISV